MARDCGSSTARLHNLRVQGSVTCVAGPGYLHEFSDGGRGSCQLQGAHHPILAEGGPLVAVHPLLLQLLCMRTASQFTGVPLSQRRR